MEITCPNCQYTREVSEEKLPARAVVATCPKCRQKFKFRELPDDDFMIEDPATSAAPQSPESPTASAPDAQDLPEQPEGDAAIAGQPEPQPDTDAAPQPDEPREPTAQDVWQRLEAMPPPEEMARESANDPQDTNDLPEEENAPYGDEGQPRDEKQGAVEKPQQPVAGSPEPEQQTEQNPQQPGAERPTWAETDSADEPIHTPGADTTGPFGMPGPDRDTAEFSHSMSDESIVVDVPWERTDKYGFFPGLGATIKRAMFSAPLFFRTMGMTRSIIKPLGFAVLLNLFALLCEYGYDLLGLPTLWLETGFNTPANMGGMDFLMLLAILPAGIVFGVFINAMIMHLLLMLVGAAKRGFEGTFRAISYGAAPMVLNIVPYVGPIVALVWSLVITFVAYRHIHRTSFVRLGLALLLPVVFILGVLLLSGALQSTDLMPR